MWMNGAEKFFKKICHSLQMSQIHFKNQWSKLEQMSGNTVLATTLDPSWPKLYRTVPVFLNILALLKI